jgi:NAD(P)-dependent dehydrogenase (short-subunit alcohol dehydrogenase family)
MENVVPDNSMKSLPKLPAYIVTGPTSGIGRETALELAKHGTVVLVGRDPRKLDALQGTIELSGGHAMSVVCDLSDMQSVRKAAGEIAALRLPIAGLVNNAGVMLTQPAKTPHGWDLSFATNHLGPFALTEALVPTLPNGAKVVFVVSAVEDPGRKPAVAAGFRGGRFISVEASARGEWQQGGSAKPGFDAYATSKQAILAAALAFSRETSRLQFIAVEPGFNPTTGLGGADLGVTMRLVQAYVIPLLVPLLMPFLKILSTPKRAARVLTQILLDPSDQTGIYYDEGGRPMQGSPLVQDHKFQDRVVDETRAFLSNIQAR